MSPALRRTSENMLVRPNGDGTYSATWTPASTGWYMVLVTIDGYPLEEVLPVLSALLLLGPSLEAPSFKGQGPHTKFNLHSI